MANIRYANYPKNQKVLQTSKKQLFQGNNLISQTSEKPKKAANMQKPALPGQTSDISMIRKTKKCCNYPKTSFTMANIRNAKHPKNQKVLQTSEKQLVQGKHPICQTSEKPKSAANIRKAACPGQTSDMSNIRKNKKCCKHPKSSFFLANIRCVKHLKNQKVMQTPENQLYHGEHPICQISEKPKSAANIRKAAFLGQTSDMSNIRKNKNAANIRKPALPWQTSEMPNIRKFKKCCKHPKSSLSRANIRYVKHPKTKKCCKHPKSSLSRANIRYVKHPKKQKVLQTSEKQLFLGKHPMCQTSEKPKSAANTRKPALPWRTSDMPNIRKTKKCCKHPKSSFSRANIRYVKHPKKQKMLQTSEKQLFQGKHPMCQTSEKPKCGANMRKPILPGQTSDMSKIRKTKIAAIIRKPA